MIAIRKSRNIAYSDFPGFEGTDEALFLAQIKVYEAMIRLNSPSWAVKGDKHFRKYLKKFHLKVPVYDFNFIEDSLPKFWDTFRFTMLEPENPGTFTPIVLNELRFQFKKLFEELPNKYRAKEDVEYEAVELMIEALRVCLESDNQLLANPVFEVVLLIWYHYRFPIA